MRDNKLRGRTKLPMTIAVLAGLASLSTSLHSPVMAQEAAQEGVKDAAPADAAGPVGRTSGLPVPRFVSLKADKVNVRSGPTRDHGVAWVFTRAGLPVEITAEFETWRRIRDADGAEGWVYHSMLSGRRTALVNPWKSGEEVSLYAEPTAKSPVRARLEAGVLGKVEHCDGKWCRFFDNGFDGFIEQERLWGVYPGEKLE
ncbi:SH3-like domain-containing protein [Ancylobacter polymorphus]|uniref:SH3-like domain-containing protein n=2 Tax=Ancylobacter polymorphus TaxID=223390 RepID=A0ABU0BG04_9HYPH|nr:SH3 domain-containing protein [Ancylobacter polymorphus]MDQ0304755.1 SH3-like domain-containing protein [Ancylobacter polymorphus]